MSDIQNSKTINILVSISVVIAIALIYYFTPIKEYFEIDKIISVTENIPDNTLSFLMFLVLFGVGACFFLPMPLAAFAVGLVFPLWVAVFL